MHSYVACEMCLLEPEGGPVHMHVIRMVPPRLILSQEKYRFACCGSRSAAGRAVPVARNSPMKQSNRLFLLGSVSVHKYSALKIEQRI